ncbi:unnamed protein product [Blepharisma stoltei]|uniref:Uncharacterized protein n=1 Tax=Blepharisma stoltei TaxID=1481888 RepID=A0AAU9JRE0_9CILI|nr:unnamed protein product [Blepharisma stoltei]
MLELQEIGPQRKITVPYIPVPSRSPGFFSMLFFTWVKPMLLLGKNLKLEQDDIPILPDEHLIEHENLTTYISKHRLFKALFLSNWKLLLLVTILGNIVVVFDFSSPIFIKLLIAYLKSEEKPLSIGLYLLLGYIFVTLINQLVKGRFSWTNQLIELKVKSSLSNVIYSKLLKAASIPSNLGVNILMVDVRKIYEGLRDLNMFITCPMQAGISMYIIYQQVGNAVFAALGTLIICIAMDMFIARRVQRFSIRIMSHRDKRIEASTQMLTNIKMIKACVWENVFKTKINSIRASELSILRLIKLFLATSRFFFWVIPSITAAIVFVYYTVVMKEKLDPEIAFVTLTTLLLLQDSLQDLSWLVSQLLICVVSVRRVQSLIDLPDLDEPNKGDKILMKNCTFAYGDKNILKNISLEVKQGEFVAVVGEVGSGKSSLLNSIMGELKIKEGFINVPDNIAYAPSLDSWIQNDTLKNNILFGKPYNEAWYLKVLDACCLIQDINSLPNKDLTEIGERGINLSGGQKARICLARAVYADKDIYLLDDPLSSVDTYVAKYIMNKCFLNVLSQKTRILVTHRLNILNKVDRVILLQNGSIKNDSSPDKIKIIEEIKETSRVEIEEPAPQQSKLIEKEEKVLGRINSHLYIDYFKFSGGYFFPFLAVLSMVLWAITRMIGDIILKNWTTNPDGIDEYLPLYLLFRVGGNIFSYIRALLMMAVVGISASKFVHHKMIESFIKAPVNLFYDVTPIGRILNRLNKDLNSIDENISGAMAAVIAQTCQVASMVTIGLIYFPIITLLLPFLVYYSLQIKELYLSAARELRRFEAISNSPILNHYAETVSGIKIIRTFQQNENFKQKNYRLINSNSRLLYSQAACKCWLSVTLGLLSSTVLWVLFSLVIIFRYNVPIDIVGLSLAYVVPLPHNILRLVGDWANLENQIIAVERAKQYIDIISENPNEISSDKNLQDWPSQPSIQFKEVYMKYRLNTPLVLQGVNLFIEAGTRAGLVGRTGSGKSSIYLCLLRLVELHAGTIFIDGVNIAMIGLHKLRSAITLVPQDPLVFSGDLRDNLDPCKIKSHEEIQEALREVNLSKFSIDYEIKSDGSNLSAGERQLISLGRAMLAHTKIILFDEATAGIDQDNDLKIQEVVKNKFKGCTILTIAHRLGTVMENDVIWVMKDGIVAEMGSPKELLSRDSLFRNLRDNFN